MELLEIMQNRHSVRKFTDEEIPAEKLDMIIKAGLVAPSGRAKRPWEFIVVRSKETLEKLSAMRPHGSQIIAGANAAIVVVGDTSATDVWTEDCSIAMAHMHLMADALGVGSCWVQGRLRENQTGGTADEYVRDLLGVPEGYALEATLCMGIPAEGAHAPATDLDQLPYDKVHSEKF